MKKRLFPLFLALLLLLSACGAGVGNSASAAAGDSGSMPDDANGWTEDASADTAESGADFSAVRKNAKLILNANLTLETQDFDKASADIEKMAADAGGYLESSSLSGCVFRRRSLRGFTSSSAAACMWCTARVQART